MVGKKAVFKERYIKIASDAAHEGWTINMIASKLKIKKSTLYKWMQAHEDLRDAINEGRDYFDSRVAESSLLKRVKGFTYTEKQLVKETSAEGEVRNKIINTKKKVLPDVTAIIFWLKNRQGDRWKDKHDIEVQGGEGLEERLRKAQERFLKRNSKPDPGEWE